MRRDNTDSCLLLRRRRVTEESAVTRPPSSQALSPLRKPKPKVCVIGEVGPSKTTSVPATRMASEPLSGKRSRRATANCLHA